MSAWNPRRSLNRRYGFGVASIEIIFNTMGTGTTTRYRAHYQTQGNSAVEHGREGITGKVFRNLPKKINISQKRKEYFRE